MSPRVVIEYVQSNYEAGLSSQPNTLCVVQYKSIRHSLARLKTILNVPVGYAGRIERLLFRPSIVLEEGGTSVDDDSSRTSGITDSNQLLPSLAFFTNLS